jgi:hypothetical protein
MNHIRLRTRQLALYALSAFLLTVCFHFPGLANANSAISGGIATTPTSGVAVATNGCVLKFYPSRLYDDGIVSSIALHSSGLALEVHKSEYTKAIWYRVGKQSAVNEIAWSNSQSTDASGYWPAVALSREGYVIEVHSDRNDKGGSQQFYRVGKIDPNGDENQTISWKTGFIPWDAGFRTSIAINDNGLIVGVHESSSSSGLYYRTGYLKNPAGGDYTIAWSSGSTGVKYDDGVYPRIAINNHNQVVEVHQVTKEKLLHYRRGTVSGGKIDFAPSQRYDDNGEEPAVALLDSGLVLELHTRDGVYSRTGKLDPSGSTLIDWTPSVKFTASGAQFQFPAVATNGRHAFQTHNKGVILYYSGLPIDCPNL